MVLSRDLQRRAQIAAGAVRSLDDVPMRAWVVNSRAGALAGAGPGHLLWCLPY